MSLALRSLTRFDQTAVGAADGSPHASYAQVHLRAYATADAAATVEASGYFNSARATLKVGDVIVATMAYGGTPVVKIYVVTAVPTSGDVTVARLTTTAG